MNIRIVLALGRNNEIGTHNKLLWDLPQDMRHFREITTGKPVIMGRKTFESIGRALPQRTNIVITRNPEYFAKGAVVVNSLQRALEIANAEQAPEVCIIGGGEIVKMALPLATHMSLTFVEHEFSEADAFFPEVEWNEWQEVSRQKHSSDEDHLYSFEFVEFERK